LAFSATVAIFDWLCLLWPALVWRCLLCDPLRERDDERAPDAVLRVELPFRAELPFEPELRELLLRLDVLEERELRALVWAIARPPSQRVAVSPLSKGT